MLRGLQGRHEEVAAALTPLRARTLAGVVIIARGSSDHAAIYGRYLLELATRRPVSLAAPSLSTRYRAQTDYSGYLAVAVSQSGHTPEIVDVLRTVRGAGAAGVAVTNDPDSPLAEAADAVIPLGVGDERAVPATKTFTAQLAAFALLAEALGPVPWSADAWQELPGQMEVLLADRAAVLPAVESLRESDGAIDVGRGFLFGAALEGALKTKEMTGPLAQGFSSADSSTSDCRGGSSAPGSSATSRQGRWSMTSTRRRAGRPSGGPRDGSRCRVRPSPRGPAHPGSGHQRGSRAPPAHRARPRSPSSRRSRSDRPRCALRGLRVTRTG